MKTLDEVIEAIEVCRDSYVAGKIIKADALYYLKEYQKIEDEYDELKDWWAEEHAENVPLTWQELKQMEGKPVWIECEYYFCPRWVILTNVYDEKAMFIGDGIVDSELKEEMGKTWQAYRKERE